MNKLFDFKHYDIIKSEIGPLQHSINKHFFTQGRWSSHELLLYLLSFSGKANVTIASFSISEITIRSFLNAIEKGYISSLDILLNSSVKRNKTDLLLFAKNVVNKIALANTHMKLTLIENDTWKIIVNQSANSTVNSAWESGVICTEKKVFDLYKEEINRALNNSIILTADDIISGTIK